MIESGSVKVTANGKERQLSRGGISTVTEHVLSVVAAEERVVPRAYNMSRSKSCTNWTVWWMKKGLLVRWCGMPNELVFFDFSAPLGVCEVCEYHTCKRKHHF